MGPTLAVKIMTILVTGATGNIGRRIVDHLIDLGANDIRALTKNPAKANLPDGVHGGHRLPRRSGVTARGARRRGPAVSGAVAPDTWM